MFISIVNEIESCICRVEYGSYSCHDDIFARFAVLRCGSEGFWGGGANTSRASSSSLPSSSILSIMNC